jgi:hypothetical protein
MKLTPYSRNKILETFQRWDVPKEFADPMYNYLVHGYSPGGFFTSVLANDFGGAIARSHPANTIEALKHLGGWITECAPRESYGGYDVVSNWCYLPPASRRLILEENNLIYSERDEVMMTLQDKPTNEPVLY